MINELQKYLAQTTLIQIADLLSLYETPKKVRYDCNWTAYCKRAKEDEHQEAIYTSDLSYEYVRINAEYN